MKPDDPSLMKPDDPSLMPSIAFSWDGLPQYGARFIRAAVDRLGQKCVVVGSRPLVPVRGMEQVLGQPIHWVERDRPVRWQDIGLAAPDIFFQAGWSYPHFTTLGCETKASGGYVIGQSDANWRGDFRQLVLGPLAFRALHRRRFDAMIVPGRQGERLMTYFGMPVSRVRQGSYGADPSLFNGGGSLEKRSKSFLYVGQFIARKNVLGLACAFKRFSELRPGWTLRLIGCGEQRDLIPADPRIIVEDFVQPEELVARYREARFFVLPSLREAWGLVVHEAALCGCGLILSDAIGSADDLSTSRNSVRFRAGDDDSLVRALVDAADRDATWLAAAEAESRTLSSFFGPQRFAAEVANLVDLFAGGSDRSGTRTKKPSRED